jgi:hypothetical protein
MQHAYQSMAAASSTRRSQPATSAASNGALTHISSAPAEISWPAAAIETARSRPISSSVPGTTMTPVPITKLPNRSGQRTAGSGSRPAGALSAADDE